MVRWRECASQYNIQAVLVTVWKLLSDDLLHDNLPFLHPCQKIFVYFTTRQVKKSWTAETA